MLHDCTLVGVAVAVTVTVDFGEVRYVYDSWTRLSPTYSLNRCGGWGAPWCGDRKKRESKSRGNGGELHYEEIGFVMRRRLLGSGGGSLSRP